MTTKDETKKSNLLAIPKEDAPCPHVIKQLEELLEFAKSGRIKSVFVVCEIRNDDPLFVQAGENKPLEMLGLLEWAKLRWAEEALIAYTDDHI